MRSCFFSRAHAMTVAITVFCELESLEQDEFGHPLPVSLRVSFGFEAAGSSVRFCLGMAAVAGYGDVKIFRPKHLRPRA